MYLIMSSADIDNYTSSFPIWIPFSSLIAVARTSKNTLNKTNTCLVLDLRGNDFSFSLLTIILAVGLSYQVS